jgi:copper chaperone CopZ
MANITHLSIQGMHCGGCVSKITKALTPLAENVEVTLDPPTVTLTNPSANLTQINRILAETGDYKAAKTRQTIEATTPSKNWLATYQPLLTIAAYILGVSLLIETQHASFELEHWMMHFMAGFFLVFSFFKMLDIRAFANSYAMYDLLAMRWPGYGLIYPFVELGLGVAYLVNYNQQTTNLITLIVMTFSSLGVIQAVMNKQKIRCACLGTVFNLPMSTVTIIEDLLMAGMAAWMFI